MDVEFVVPVCPLWVEGVNCDVMYVCTFVC